MTCDSTHPPDWRSKPLGSRLTAMSLRFPKLIFVIAFSYLAMSCESSTHRGSVESDRRQLLLVPESQIIHASEQAYEQTKDEAKRKGRLDVNPLMVARLKAIHQKLVEQIHVFRADAMKWAWEVHVIQEDELNAYCMPGGKIMFYSGIIDRLDLSDSEIAAIMGHEMAHALREHGRERMSEALLQKVGLDLLLAKGSLDPKYAAAIRVFGALVISLPHGRTQELEADDVGLELMARAGYDPNMALVLWHKMAGASGAGKPPELLSTHPSDANRIRRIETLIPKVMPLYLATQKS